ncbi:MAG: twin-arginine translocase TatA/TatE family subunit [Candidatus Dadabacteria bacterium]|nr:twin-arginine translocase TatA/TatE family subunit [Candidatus Dadabacteria bacterium]
MFGLGFGEIAVICLVAVLFMGPDDFVKLTRLAAKGIREFRVFKQEIKDSVEKTVERTDKE